MPPVSGIHHVTSIASEPRRNVEFYTRALGMRLVKKSVNQDDTGTYHLFYADGAGHPGSDMTFFPWAHLPPGVKGTGLTNEVSLAVPPDTLDFWAARLARFGVEVGEPAEAFGERLIRFADPDGLELALVESSDDQGFSAWDQSPVEAAAQVRRIHGIHLWQRDLGASAAFLTEVLGFAELGAEQGVRRYGLDGGRSGALIDIRDLPDVAAGRWGHGSVHHVAWRVPDEQAQHVVRQAIARAGRRPTPIIDRFWFRSVYFFEPGGALFEIATDGPGFAIDEDAEHLGERLILPPWLEPQRARIEAALPPLGEAASVGR